MQNNQISISEFKAHCLEIISQLEHNHRPIFITKRDKLVAKVEFAGDESKDKLFGAMKNRASIKKDILKPIGEKWSADD